MVVLIDKYFANHLSLSDADATRLHSEYYKKHGLAIEGLVRNHQIDPLEFNEKVDDALPLEEILSRDSGLRTLLHDMDKSKVKLWLFTNAYITHARRVVRLLGIDDLFEGLTYCDYSTFPLLCKPYKDTFAKAMKEAGVEDPAKCYFVDDSAANCTAAEKLGWTVTHFLEEGVETPKNYVCQNRIQHLQELRTLFPQFFGN